MISPTDLSSSNHTPSSHSNHSGSSFRHGTPSPTISAPPSTASPAPSGGSYEIVGTPDRVPLRHNGKTVRYGALMDDLRALGVRPKFVTNEAWNRYREYWAFADFKARSEKASHNRKSEKGGPSTGPSKHTGGTRFFRTYENALDMDEEDEVTPNDVFLHVHTKEHDGVTFIDNRSTQFHAELVRRREEHTQATPDRPIDEKQLYYDAVGECSKGHVYGLRSLAKWKRIYEDPGASTSRESMVWLSELDAVVQRLAQFEAFVQSQLGMRMDFRASTFQAPPPPPLPPPPPPPQEHHQQINMDSARSPQQKHDHDDEDNYDWLDEEQLGDKS
ncbi:hypothetical protein Scep_002022 [Stephania cephalantha]|uniref:Uncharacterized protein n=1 Tax=Stephania cephalantha TaxID=152367 RepID=A0AAP0L9I7_9MAGN